MDVDVAVLYVDPRGPYPSIPGVDAWDEKRDARDYRGPLPVVAHPPCGPWGSLRHLSTKDDPNLAPIGLWQVRYWGGVLEHPRRSKLFDALNLPKPGDPPDEWGGYTVDVNQCDWGHVARKPTRLYCVGVPRSELEAPEPREPTHWCSGRRNPFPRATKGPPPGCAPAHIKFCSMQQRRRTPPDFARYLVKLARSVRR